MKVGYHPDVQRDVSAVLRHYDAISPRLGDEFWAELMSVIERTAQNPGRSHPVEGGLRRINLERFPYHFLFRLSADRIRITVVRHHKQHPARGSRRR
jgi:plasmid stabilization system protein ParE